MPGFFVCEMMGRFRYINSCKIDLEKTFHTADLDLSWAIGPGLHP